MWRCSCSRVGQLPNRHMIRAACTWLLIVLAASPFTAPFSTCDVSALFANRASSMIAPSVLPCADIATCSETDDAGSISPVVGRVVLSRNAVLMPIDWPIPPMSDALELSRPAPVQDGRVLDDAPVQPLVLRL
jgi:hypothetical protein